MNFYLSIIPDLSTELVYQTSRSSGPGGQNVNKVNSRVELRFDIMQSQQLLPEQKELLLVKLASRLTTDGVLILTRQTERSQLKNKELVTAAFYELLRTALKPVKKRRATHPRRAAVEKRLQKKKMRSERKETRRKIDY